MIPGQLAILLSRVCMESCSLQHKLLISDHNAGTWEFVWPSTILPLDSKLSACCVVTWVFVTKWAAKAQR